MRLPLPDGSAPVALQEDDAELKKLTKAQKQKNME